MLNDFISIDFETANPNKVSACSLGVVKVVNGEIVDRKSYFIKPVGGFSHYNSMITGICECDTANAPTFDVLWNDLKGDFETFPILSYSSFDRLVLETLADYYDLKLEAMPSFIDVYMMVRKCVNGLSNYKLPTVAEHLGLKPLEHHDATNDAEQCARIYLSIGNVGHTVENECKKVVTSHCYSLFVDLANDLLSRELLDDEDMGKLCSFLDSFKRAYGNKIYSGLGLVVRSMIDHNALFDMVASNNRREEKIKNSELVKHIIQYLLWFNEQSNVDCVGDDNQEGAAGDSSFGCQQAVEQPSITIPQGFVPKVKDIPTNYKERWEYVKEHPFTTLASANVVITGGSPECSRALAEKWVQELGCALKSGVTRTTDFLVVLDEISTSGKSRKAREMIESGSSIRIIHAKEFVELVQATIREGTV